MHKQGYSEMKAGRRINDMAKIVASVLVLLSLTFTFGCSSTTTQTTTSPGTTTTPPTSSGTFQAMANLGLYQQMRYLPWSKRTRWHGAGSLGFRFRSGSICWHYSFCPECPSHAQLHIFVDAFDRPGNSLTYRQR
jgi:hypothetical protein